MSRFADDRAFTRVDLGPCECPGRPHDEDWANVRSDLSAAEIARFSETTSSTVAIVAAEYVLEWNLVGLNGEPWDPSPISLLALKLPSLAPIVKAISDACLAKKVPNASGAPSRSSSRASASPTRTIQPSN